MAGVTLSSCRKELLDDGPETSIADASAFDTPTRIQGQVLSLYTTLKSGQFYGGRFLVYGSIRGDEFISEDPNGVTGRDIWELVPTNSSTSITGFWAQAYFVINSCNVFIDGMNEKGTSVVGNTLGANYVAEARLIRAISYYSLLQHFCRPFADGAGSKLGLPLRLTGIKGPGFTNMARSTVAEVYTQILADLDYAEANLPATYTAGVSVTNTTRAHRNTAISFKTRVYLSMQNYAKVITEANKIVPAAAPFTATSGIPHTLEADYVNIFKAPYTSRESIFSLPFTTNTGDIPGTQNGLQSYYYASATGTGSIYSLNPAGIIGDPGWTANDRRKALVYTAASGKKYLSKFPIAAPADYSPVIRWAEVLLNLAEAKVRQNNVVDAQSLALLNAVRQRSDAAVILAPATPADFYAAVLKERQIEFLGEGLRNNDMMRLLLTIPAKGTVLAKGPGDDGYIWPASANEKSLNNLWVD